MCHCGAATCYWSKMCFAAGCCRTSEASDSPYSWGSTSWKLWKEEEEQRGRRKTHVSLQFVSDSQEEKPNQDAIVTPRKREEKLSLCELAYYGMSPQSFNGGSWRSFYLVHIQKLQLHRMKTDGSVYLHTNQTDRNFNNLMINVPVWVKLLRFYFTQKWPFKFKHIRAATMNVSQNLDTVTALSLTSCLTQWPLTVLQLKIPHRPTF